METGGLVETMIGFCDLMLPSDKYPEGYKFTSDEVEIPSEGLRFVGIMSLKDPLRPDIPDAISKCLTAGIRVILATGDHPITARAMACYIGIETAANTNSKVITGTELSNLSIAELDEILKNHREIIFARITPYHRLEIVEACQREGAIVAVTGKSMNDTPALKRANIGAALGVYGHDVCKQAADVILLDDNFASIVAGVEEARLYIDNIQKNFSYTLISIIPEIILFILFAALNIPALLGTLIIIYILLAAPAVSVFALIIEKTDTEIMKKQPRKSITNCMGKCCRILIAIIRKLFTVLLSTIVAFKLPAIMVSWIAIRIALYLILSWISIRKTSSDFSSLMVIKDEMSLLICPQGRKIFFLYSYFSGL